MSGRQARTRRAEKAARDARCGGRFKLLYKRGSWYGKHRIGSMSIRTLRLSRRVHRARRKAGQL